ncbi:MAG: ABC transporter permease [Planctomycetes bacterium]|nr:ABC transporter permease [Planctomycetota bacterium]
MKRASLWRTVRLGVSSLLLHKLRSALTTLGVLFGTSSVIAMLAIGEGASEKAQAEIRLLGSQNVILRSVKPREDFASNQQTRVNSYGLTDSDYARVSATFPGVGRVVPVREIYEEVRRGSRAMNPRVLACPPVYRDVTGRQVLEGRWITDQDERGIANVCVLSDEVARYLFPVEAPLGQTVKVGADYYTVVGTLMPRTRQRSDAPGLGEQTQAEVFIPLETGRKWYGNLQVKMRSGSREMEEVELHEVVIEVDQPDSVPTVAAAAREMLSRYHTQKDYEVVVPLEQLLLAEKTKRIFNLVLGSIASISLLVGGIGIMNVMLATVTERTREIGIRRALGAKRRHIVTQFLVETVVLSVGGGLLGVALGLIVPLIVEHFADMPTVITPSAPILAFLISAGVGVVFGIYPAWRAANMDPVEALRHE